MYVSMSTVQVQILGMHIHATQVLILRTKAGLQEPSHAFALQLKVAAVV